MKSNYADLIHRFNKKIGAKNIHKIFKIKAQMTNYPFFNGKEFE